MTLTRPTPDLRDNGAIALVSCYEMGHQPLALANAAAALRASGYRPKVIDLSVTPFSTEFFDSARVVAISAPMHTALRLGASLAQRLRETRPGCKVVFFGLYATLNEAWLRGIADDCLVSETGLPEAMERMQTGILSRTETALRPRAAFTPDRAGLPALTEYAQLEEHAARRLAGYVEASRGCLHRCRHCPVPAVYAGRFFIVPQEVVLADIRQQALAGATHISFGDPDFMNGPQHSMRVVRQMRDEFPELTFDITTKVQHILERAAFFPELRELGCSFVVSAVESLSDRVLEILDKGHSRKDVDEALSVLQSAQLPMRPTWLPFTPWTSLEDFRDILRFVQDRQLVDSVDPVQFTIRLLVPPGSLLAESEAMRPHLRELDLIGLSYRWEHPDRKMDALQSELSRLVERLAGKVDDREIFREICRLSGVPIHDRGWNGTERRTPRLTEPWFC